MENIPLEIEKKFLIAMPDTAWLSSVPETEKWEIRQTYLECECGKTERVRLIVCNQCCSFFHTVKFRLSNEKCVEQEEQIDEKVYLTYLNRAKTDCQTIEKTRYRIPWKNQKLEIDIYPFWSDRAVLEVELQQEGQTVNLPGWIRVFKEVTADHRYKNAFLAKNVITEKLDLR